MEGKIASFHKKNLFIWGAILGAVVILTVIAYILKQNQAFIPMQQNLQLNQVFFIIAIALAAAILLFKRAKFVPARIADRLSQNDSGGDKIERLLPMLLRNYFIVWTLGEAIAVVGFINFVLTNDFSSFMIFAVVSAYSLLINIPSEGLVYKCLELMEQ